MVQSKGHQETKGISGLVSTDQESTYLGREADICIGFSRPWSCQRSSTWILGSIFELENTTQW